MLILHMFFGWSRQVSMGNLALSFRRWDYSSILHTAVSPIKYRGIGENRLCICYDQLVSNRNMKEGSRKTFNQ